MTRILITGNFTQVEIAQLAQAVREIEQTRPHELFTFNFNITDDLIDPEEMVRQIFPFLPGYSREIIRVDYDNKHPADQSEVREERGDGSAGS
jgi:hypothetical protein